MQTQATLPPLGAPAEPGSTERPGHSKLANWALGISILVSPIIGGIMGIVAHRRDKREGRRYGRAKAAWIIGAAWCGLIVVIAVAAIATSASADQPTLPKQDVNDAVIDVRPNPAPAPAPKADPVPAPVDPPGVSRSVARQLLQDFNADMRDTGVIEDVRMGTDDEDGRQQLASFSTVPYAGLVMKPGEAARKLTASLGTVDTCGDYGPDGRYCDWSQTTSDATGFIAVVPQGDDLEVEVAIDVS